MNSRQRETLRLPSPLAGEGGSAQPRRLRGTLQAALSGRMGSPQPPLGHLSRKGERKKERSLDRFHTLRKRPASGPFTFTSTSTPSGRPGSCGDDANRSCTPGDGGDDGDGSDDIGTTFPSRL